MKNFQFVNLKKLIGEFLLTKTNILIPFADSFGEIEFDGEMHQDNEPTPPPPTPPPSTSANRFDHNFASFQ